jgi:hypothetical protein
MAKVTKKTNAREVEVFRKTLRKNKQVVPKGKPLGPGVTHVESTDKKGNTKLVRKRFSAV